MATTDKRKAVVDRLLKKNTSEPTINALNYNASFAAALNFYNLDYSNKDKKRWFQEHFKRTLKFPISEIHEREFRSVGTMCRILDNGNELSDEHMTFIKNEVERLRALSKKQPVAVVEDAEQVKQAKVVSIQERMDNKISDFMAEFNAMVDESKKIVPMVQRQINELEEALLGKDKQLVEGYSNFKKADLKKLLELYTTLVAKMDQAKKVVVRAPRAKKEKPASQIVARLNFCKENTELGLRSVTPTMIVGATEIWAFNAKTKKLQVYKAVNGMTLTVKGSSLLNFNVEDSVQKTVRDPKQVANLNEKGKRAYSTFLKTIKTKEAPVNGRINAETLILAAFK
jgi:hypothetical protein